MQTIQSGLDLSQYKALVVRPILGLMAKTTGIAVFASPAAANLLTGLPLKESGLRYLRQNGGGPALSLNQIEPVTQDDIEDRQLAGTGNEAVALRRCRALIVPPGMDRRMALATNLAYGVFLARCKFRQAPQALPDANDAAGLAAYWKAHYNTPQGAGNAAEAVQYFAAGIAA